MPRSDVFALAATAYHLLTDDDPREHPSSGRACTALPRELSLALERALRPDPSSAAPPHELRQALETISTPSRTLEAFTFPGGAQIRTVGALPALCDEHWDAARRFLYNGDFQRWLRDINRHDLVVAAEELLATEPNQDAGLERFLHQVDPGLPHPQMVADRPTVDLGGVARESALIEHVSLQQPRARLCAGCRQRRSALDRGFPRHPRLALGAARRSQHQHPRRGPAPAAPAARRRHRGAPDVPDTQIAVLARVSIWREVLRLIWRAVAAALPAAWRRGVAAWQLNARLTQSVARPFVRHPWLFWVLWLLLSGGLAAGLYYGRDLIAHLLWVGPQITTFLNADQLPRIALTAALAPPLLLVSLLLLLLVTSIAGSTLYGAIEGAWSSFAR